MRNQLHSYTLTLTAIVGMGLILAGPAQAKKGGSKPIAPTTTTSTTTTTIAASTSTTTATGGNSGVSDTGDGNQYSIIAVGTVRGVSRTITLQGIRRKTWAQFALWMDDNRRIYFKSGETFTPSWLHNLKKWCSLAGNSSTKPTLCYGGDWSGNRSEVQALPWHEIARVNPQS